MRLVGNYLRWKRLLLPLVVLLPLKSQVDWSLMLPS